MVVVDDGGGIVDVLPPPKEGMKATAFGFNFFDFLEEEEDEVVIVEVVD